MSPRALRSIPRAAWICAVIASLNAVCWSVITPPFETPDEPSHLAYTQQLAETGRLPASGNALSPEEEVLLRALHQGAIVWHPEVHTISSPAAQRRLQMDLNRPLHRSGPGDAGVAAAEPPLYYALETIPYYIGSGGSLLVRIELMRLLSALMAGATALFVFLFVRELLPGNPGAWMVGGLGGALVGLLGSTSGAVTPDAMLCAVCAAIFYCLARAFQRGLTRKLGIALGSLIATGFLTKLNFIGVAPGVMVGLVVLAFRGIPASACKPRSRRAFGSMVVAMSIAVLPVCFDAVRNLLRHHPILGIVSSAAPLALRHESPLSTAVYIWDLYLPRLPGTVNYFPGLATTRELWFDRAVGLYGWLDTGFPVWVYKLALVPAGLIAGLVLHALIRSRAALRARASELLVYLAVSVGLMALIGTDAHLNRLAEDTGYAEPRYLLPLLPLLAATLALAVRGAGRRWGPSVGALVVVLFLAQDIFSQLQVVARFYG